MSSMRAVVLHPPSYDIRVEEIPIPDIQDPDDAIVKISLAGLCGSDLHAYRGHAPFSKPFVMGHEFVGEVVKLGPAYSDSSASTRPALYGSLKVGDRVVSPFSISCGECRFCNLGFTSRCVHSQLIGHETLPGAQAQYIRVPKAGGTLFLAPAPLDQHGQKVPIADSSLLLLADILPTGYFAALQALGHQNLRPYLAVEGEVFLDGEASGAADKGAKQDQETLVFAIVGLGPVGLCALVGLLDLLKSRYPERLYHVLAIDLNAERRTKAQKMLSKMDVSDNLVSVVAPDAAKDTLKGLGTEASHGCHAVLEVVGNNSALQLAYDLIRSFGVISSVGVHTNPAFPLGGGALYNKNVALNFGRCPVRTIFPRALDLLVRRQDVFGLVGDEAGLVDRVVGMTEAEVKPSYVDFDTGRAGKTLFDPWK